MDCVGCKGHVSYHVDERKGGGWFSEKEKGTQVGTSLVAPWIRIHLPVQRIQV